MRTGLGQGPLGDTTAGGGHDDVQTAETINRGLQDLFGAGEVGDIDRVERRADRLGNTLAVGPLAVQYRHVSTAFCQ